MLKKRSKAISMLIVSAFLFTMILPGMAFGADPVKITNSTVKGVETDAGQDLGFVKISDIDACDAVYVEMTLPDHVDFDDAPVDISDYIEVVGSLDDGTFIASGTDEDEYTAYFAGDDELGVAADGACIKLLFSGDASVEVGNSAPDDIYATVTVKGVEGGLLVWKYTQDCLIGVQGDAEMTVSVDDVKTVAVGSDQKIADITFSENMAEALREEDKIVLTLPSGMEWDDASIEAGKYGLDATAAYDGDELTITISDESSIFADSFDLKASIVVFPNAADGDVEIDIAGGDPFTPDFDDVTVVAAYVGASDGIITVEDDQDDNVFIGQVGAKADTFTIETTGGPFREGDDIILTLGKGAIWGIQNDENLSNDWGQIGGGLASEDLDCLGLFDGLASIWLRVPDGESYDEIEFSNMPLLVLPYNMGTDITVSLSGTYTSADSVVIASPIAPATVSAEKTAVEMSALHQAAGDITITESKKDAFTSLLGDDGSNFIFLELPTGVYFTDAPAIEVNGDEADVTLYSSYDYNFNDHEELGTTGTTDPASKPDFLIAGGAPGCGYDEDFSGGSQTLIINFDNAGSDFRSNRIDTITISDIAYDFDTRFRSAGDVTVKIGGRLINDWLSVSTASGQEMVEAAMYSVANAAARGSDSASSVFVIGSTAYTVNGAEYTMDVAPYISGDRTYLPVRFVAYALGVSENDILWDAASQTVTLIKDNKVIQLKAGSNELLVNGAIVTMDVVPEITNERVCLPIRFAAQAFGAIVGWDAETQTVSIDM